MHKHTLNCQGVEYEWLKENWQDKARELLHDPMHFRSSAHQWSCFLRCEHYSRRPWKGKDMAVEIGIW
jgi:hypothetical protein